ncbi:hypothetical protein, partial [Paraburkholderia mimosarum]|uniref:hypothetical protein n=1 Tax=Paraburkholderia mimosarum TaxID=312026 RepID=UPI0020D0A252
TCESPRIRLKPFTSTSVGTAQSIVSRGSTAGKVRRPRRVKRIGLATYFHVTDNRNRRSPKQPGYPVGL